MHCCPEIPHSDKCMCKVWGKQRIRFERGGFLVILRLKMVFTSSNMLQESTSHQPKEEKTNKQTTVITNVLHIVFGCLISRNTFYRICGDYSFEIHSVSIPSLWPLVNQRTGFTFSEKFAFFHIFIISLFKTPVSSIYRLLYQNGITRTDFTLYSEGIFLAL